MNTVFYSGVINNLCRRIYQHKNRITDGFTSKYKINKLVYYELFESINDAILRKKQIKGGSRQSKIDLIRKENKGFKDLFEELCK